MVHDRGYEQAAHLYDLLDTKGDSASSPTSVQYRLIRAAKGPRKTRGWWTPVALMLGSLVGLVVRPQS